MALSSPNVESTPSAEYAEREAVPNEANADHGKRLDAAPPTFSVTTWDRKMFLSDFIADGLAYLRKRGRDLGKHLGHGNNNNDDDDDDDNDDDRVIMLYEAPSTYSSCTTFHNPTKFRVHDYPPTLPHVKTVMDPCRYSLANGAAYPSFLRDGAPPPGLMEHWESTIPNWVRPAFTNRIPTQNSHGEDEADKNVLVYAYLPCEAIANERHVIDPVAHHRLCGKDILPLITSQTPRFLPSARPCRRPCIVKTTHSSGSRGIFVIASDHDERAFQAFWEEARHPKFVITELVTGIRRNMACHFFVHPNGQDLTVVGSSENYRFRDGEPHNPSLPFSSDSYWSWSDQELLGTMQLGLVQEVARYCLSAGFWGFCGIDVLLDASGRTFLIDVNPRVTGSLPSLLVANLFHGSVGFQFGVFRRSGPATYYNGLAQQLLDDVARFNRAHPSECQVVVFSFFELHQGGQTTTKIQIGVYGRSMDQCRQVLGDFANEKSEM
jgi:hypothetical protein